MMSKPSTREQVVVLCQRLRFPSGGNAPPTVEECLDEILRTDAALRDEGGRLKAEVREWLCTTCHFVYPGPPQEGVACVVCPRCGGDCGPRLSMNVRDLCAENERLKEDTAQLIVERDEWKKSAFGVDSILATVQKERDDLTAQLSTMTQERDEALARECTLMDTLPLVVKARDFFDQQHAAAMETVGTLSDTLATARQEVWEDAAIYWDTMAEGPCKDGDDFALACRVAQWCREQAQKETR